MKVSSVAMTRVGSAWMVGRGEPASGPLRVRGAVTGVVEECCEDAGICNCCASTICLTHSDPPAVICEVSGLTCGPCHNNCTSVRCALEYADPDV